MAESQKLETLVYCLGPVGGPENPVISQGSEFTSKLDYTTKGYARYIEEANNVIRFQNLVINYFLKSVKSEFEEDPLAFIDAENEEDLQASIQKMKQQWWEMFKEHQKKLRESLQNQRWAFEQSSDESSSSSAKIPRIDPDAISQAESTDTHSTWGIPVGTPVVRMPVESVEYPESIFLKRIREFGRVLKAQYEELRAKMGRALDRITSDVTVHDLKGFTLKNMEKFAKWKYGLKTLDCLVPELESNLGELDLDFKQIKENETRLTEWVYFDDGKRDRKYHHRLLIPIELTVSIEEISALVWRKLRRWKKISKSLANKLPDESETFEEKVKLWKREVLGHTPSKRPFKNQKSTESNDTLLGLEDMPDET